MNLHGTQSRWRISWCWQQGKCASSVWSIFQEDVHEAMPCALWLLTNTTAAELFQSLNDYVSGILNWLFCVSVFMDETVAMTGRLSGFTTQVKDVTSECESTHGVIHREMLANLKLSPEVNNILQDMIKIINCIKVQALNIFLCSSVRR